MAKAGFCDFDCFFGKIQDGEVFAAAGEEVVYKSGFAAADINDGSGANVRSAFDQGE